MSGFLGVLSGGVTYTFTITTQTDSFGDAIRYGYVQGTIGTLVSDVQAAALTIIELFTLDGEISNGSPADDGPGVNLSITGFSADPGKNWLKTLRRTDAAFPVNTVTGPSATIYQWTSGSGTASWFWQGGDIGMASGIQSSFAIGV